MLRKNQLGIYVLLLVTVVAGLLAARCAPATAPTPDTAALEAAQATAEAAADALATAEARGEEGIEAAQATAEAAKEEAEAAQAAIEATQAAAEAAEEAAKQELVIAFQTESQGLESHFAAFEVNSPGLRNVFEMLIDRDPQTGEIVPELATSWERLDDTTIRFYLREGVTFHDGSPFNAESAAFGINWTWSEENNFPIRTFVGPEITAEAVDEYTLDVSTAEPDPLLFGRMYFSAMPSMQAIEEDPEAYPTNPVGTGPYKFVEWNRGQDVRFEANPDWWGHDNPEARGEVVFDRIEILFRPEASVRTAMLVKGEADIATFLPPDQCEVAEVNEGSHCETVPSLETLFVRFDEPSPVLGDERVRRAIMLAIDSDTIIDEIIEHGTPAVQIVGPTAVGYNPELEPYPYDPERARELIAEARQDGVPIDETTLMINVRQAAIPRIAELAQAVLASLRDVGLNVDMQIQEASVFNPEYAEWPSPDRNYITIHPHGNEIMDYAASLDAYYRCQTVASTICDPEVDEMIDESNELSGQERVEKLQEIAEYVHEKVHTGFIAHLDLAYGVNDRIEWDIPLDHRIHAKDMRLAE
jgi:peptide/nickel transport system substrate-binding protein